MPDLIAFDVDETLWCSGGPVQPQHLVKLKSRGHTLGLCGNWGLVTSQVQGWQKVFSFIGPIGIAKDLYLNQLRTYVPSDRYFMVGNDHKRGLYRSPNDRLLSNKTGFEFVSELDFVDRFQLSR